MLSTSNIATCVTSFASTIVPLFSMDCSVPSATCFTPRRIRERLLLYALLQLVKKSLPYPPLDLTTELGFQLSKLGSGSSVITIKLGPLHLDTLTGLPE